VIGLPVRPELVGEVPYGAPQLDVPVCLNVNENPYPPSESVIAEMAAAVGVRDETHMNATNNCD
jgi:histidinol-phosphate aminotransferase